MDEIEFDKLWELNARANMVLGRVNALLKNQDLDSDLLDEMTDIIKEANETIQVCKHEIMALMS